MTAIRSVDMSAGRALSSLDGADYDLWTNLYGQIVSDVQNATYKLDHAAQEVMGLKKTEGQQ